MENVLQNCSNLAKAEVPSSVQKAKNIINAIAVSSAEAERGFSKMNIIYSDKRSRLTVENVANLMIINLIGLPFSSWEPTPLFLFFFCFICHIYPPFTRKRIVSLYFGREVRTRLGVAFFEVYGSPVFHIKVGRPVKCLAQGRNKQTCRLVLHNLP